LLNSAEALVYSVEIFLLMEKIIKLFISYNNHAQETKASNKKNNLS
jgi:hypothetical protein